MRGPIVGKQHAYVLVRDWLGEPQAVDRETALAELARRYLRGHGAGVGPRSCKVGGPAPARRPGRPRGDRLGDGDGGGAVRLRGTEPAPRGCRAPRLLGAFDPSLVGWSSREEIVGAHGPRIVTGGIFRPFALTGGRAVAVWKWAGERGRDRARSEDISGRATKALQRDAADVARFLKI